MKTIKANLHQLTAIANWPERVLQALNILDGEQQQRFEGMDKHVDGQIYDGFIGDGDARLMEEVRNASPDQLSSYIGKYKDERLKQLLPLYKARNFPRKLTDEERAAWELYKAERLTSGGANSRLAKYFARLQQISERPGITESQKYLLEDLKLYGESIMPADD